MICWWSQYVLQGRLCIYIYVIKGFSAVFWKLILASMLFTHVAWMEEMSRESSKYLDFRKRIYHLGILECLNVHKCAKKTSNAQCEALVEEITTSTRVWNSRNLSYTTRVQLVNSVLLSLHVYWAYVFTLPKKFLVSLCPRIKCALLRQLEAWDTEIS